MVQSLRSRGFDVTAEHHVSVPIEVDAQPSTAVWGRAGRCLEAGEQSSEGLLNAVLWCLLTIRAGTSMDIDDCHMAGLCHMAGSSWQLGRHLGSRAESAGPGNRAGRRGCTVSWAISWAGGNRAGHQLGRGTGPGWGTGWGTGPGWGTGWDQPGWVAPLVRTARRAMATPTA